MSTSWQHLPAPAAALARAVQAAVDAALAADAEGFDAAAAALAARDPEQVRVVLGALLRSLLEEGHPGGIDGEDVAAVVEGCVRGAAWAGAVDPDAVVVVLAGALGVHPDEEQDAAPVPAPVAARHAALLAAHLLPASPRPLRAHLQEALGEVARAETVEMP